MIPLLLACAQPEPLQIGAKPFTEQRILAHLLAEQLRAEGHLVAEPVEVVDTWDAHARLASGELDLMVEYEGTAASLLGLGGEDDLVGLYEQRGFTWGPELGFDNGYRVFVTERRARTEDLEVLSDLSGQTLEVASPPEFVQRSADGLGPLTRRYGLGLEGPPLQVSDPAERYDLLLEGRADLAIGYATDGTLTGRPLRALEDDLDFFPGYGAFVLLGPAAPEGLALDLAPLEDSLDEARMQALVHRVEVRGHRPRSAARALRAELGLAEASRERGPHVLVAIAPHQHLEAEGQRALEAVTQGLPGHTAQLLEVDDPLEALRDGRARLAVVSAQDFFEPGRFGPRQGSGTAALAVLGTRVVHRLETEASGRSITAGPGDARVTQALAEGYRLVELSPNPDLPAARPVRLVAGTYPGQDRDVDTLGLQILLAGPSSQGLASAAGGPASGLRAPQAWSSAEIEALSSSIGHLERPDPSLPTNSGPHAGGTLAEPGLGPPAWLDTLLNTGAVAFLVLVLGLGLHEKPD